MIGRFEEILGGNTEQMCFSRVISVEPTWTFAEIKVGISKLGVFLKKELNKECTVLTKIDFLGSGEVGND